MTGNNQIDMFLHGLTQFLDKYAPQSREGNYYNRQNRMKLLAQIKLRCGCLCKVPELFGRANGKRLSGV